VGWNTGFDQFNPAIDLSAGPYLVHSAAPGGSAVLVRNPSWWGTPGVLRQVTVTVAQHPSAWAGGLSASNQVAADVTDFGLADLNQVSSLPNTQSMLKPSLSSLELDFDVTSPVMRHMAARQAVAHLVDQTALLEHTFGSVDPDLVVSQDHLATPEQSSYQASSAAGEYSTPDPTLADHLLRTIGFHQDASGRYVDADGRQLNLRMAVESGDPWIGQVAGEIAAELRSAGIAVTLTTVKGTSGLAEAAANDSYDLALVTRTFTPFSTATGPWYSDSGGFVGTDQSQDWSKLDDPEVDALFSQASQELDPVAGGTIYAQIDDQLWDQMVALPLFAEPALVVNGVQLSGVTYNPSSAGILWNLPLWADLKPAPVAKS
jgi:peptide/nickel transport system substrate-binding protein